MPLELNFDKAIFSTDAILATVYWCADRIVADVRSTECGFLVSLNPREGLSMSQKDVEDFNMMVVHNQMRHQLSEKFAPIERAIIEKAFAPVSK